MLFSFRVGTSFSCVRMQTHLTGTKNRLTMGEAVHISGHATGWSEPATYMIFMAIMVISSSLSVVPAKAAISLSTASTID